MQFVSYMTPGFPASLFQQMASHIGAELHLEQELSGPAPGEDPFASGRYDIGWVCSTSYVDLLLSSPEPTVALAGVAWVPDDPDVGERPVYFGDLVVRADSTARSLHDLAGGRIGCNDPVSLSGHHALRFAIEASGADPDSFAELVFTGGHHASLDQVVAGGVDAAVVDSVVRIGRSRIDPEVAGLRIVERLGPWPVQPLIVRSSMAEAEIAGLRTALLAAAARPELQAELQAAALSGLVEVGPDHYEPVRRAMVSARNRSGRGQDHGEGGTYPFL